VVMRVVGAVGNLRKRAMYQALRWATITAARRGRFRIVHVSIQRTHVHMLVEAKNAQALARGMQGFQIAAARNINAMLATDGQRRRGQVFADPSVSAVVRRRQGVVTVTDGPYLRSPDQVAGQYLVDCESRERAVELAALMLGGRTGGVEVRPLMDSAGMEM